jgi:predicted transcriptional regulator
MNDKDFKKRVREMNRDLRPLERRRDELIKKAKYTLLSVEDDAELMALFDELSNKCSQNIEEMLALSGLR